MFSLLTCRVEKPEYGESQHKKGKKKQKAKDPERATPQSDHLGYYKILEVPLTASDSDITKAYRRLCLLRHPDKPTGSTEAFQQLGQAYSVLRDGNLRALYDMGWTPRGCGVPSSEASHKDASGHDQRQPHGDEDTQHKTTEETQDKSGGRKAKRKADNEERQAEEEEGEATSGGNRKRGQTARSAAEKSKKKSAADLAEDSNDNNKSPTPKRRQTSKGRGGRKGKN